MVTLQQCMDVLQGSAEHKALQKRPVREQCWMEPGGGEYFFGERNTLMFLNPGKNGPAQSALK